MTRVDGDALAAARAEALVEPNVFTRWGREWKLVDELTIDAASAYRAALSASTADNADIDAAREFVNMVLADETESAEFWSMHPAWGDIHGLFSVFLPKAKDAGESSASSRSSPKGGKRSRPTSPRTTT